MELDSDAIKKIRRQVENKESVFSDKSYLDSLFLPSGIIGRNHQARQLIEYFESQKQGLVVPLISVYGRSGSGKSTTVQFVMKELSDIVVSRYVNFRRAKTVFGSANMILSALDGESLNSAEGLNKAVDKIGQRIQQILRQEKKKFFCIILDEYDVIFYDKRGKPSDFMYKLLTLEEDLRLQDMWLCIITISNNALADYSLDDRVKSRIGSSEVFFDSYDMKDVQSILEDRARHAFSKKPAKSVIEYCATIASDDHGDARRALDLLRIAGEISDGHNVTKKDIDRAHNKLQNNRVSKIVSGASYHQRCVIAAVCSNLLFSESGWTPTSLIYDKYYDTIKEDKKPLSYRRVADLLVELDNLGLTVSRAVSRGRGGYGREYKLQFPPDMVGFHVDAEWWKNQLERKMRLDSLREYRKTLSKMSRGRMAKTLLDLDLAS